MQIISTWQQIILGMNENAWAFTYLPLSPIVQSFCQKVLLFVKIERRTQINYVTSYRDVMISLYDVISVTMSLNLDQTSHHCAKLLHNEISPNDLNLWPTTLTYNPSLAKINVKSHTKNQCHRSNGHTDTKTAPILWPRPLTWKVIISIPFASS